MWDQSWNRIHPPFLEVPRRLLDRPPRRFDVSLFGPRLPDTETKGEAAVQDGVGQVQLSARVQPVHQLAVEVVPRAVAEADEVQGRRRGELELLRALDVFRESLRK